MFCQKAVVESRTQRSRPRPRIQIIRGQGQGPTLQGQTLSRPRTGMGEAKDQGHNFSNLWAANFPQFKRKSVQDITFR